MAIDVKTLRIGSHILVDGKRERVRGLDEDNGLIVRFPAEYVLASEVEPIPISPELLKELGLNVISHGCSEHWFLGNFDLTHNTDSCYWDYEGDIRVEFLHELEDLYYLKYGVELIPD